MSLTRRRLFTGMIEAPRNSEWISARGREAAMAGHAEAQMAAPGTRVIRISSNENPLGPGQHVVDAIVGQVPRSGALSLQRHPEGRRPHRGAGAEVQRQEREHRARAGLGRDPDPRRARLHLADQAAGHRLAVVREPARHRQEDRHAGARSGLRRQADASTSPRWSRRRRAPAWCSSATRTTRPPRCTARPPSPTWSRPIRAAVARRDDPDRRGLPRLRDRPGLPDPPSTWRWPRPTCS